MKKVLSIVLMMALLVGVVCMGKPSESKAATLVYAPTAVGTYNEFGQGIRLDINPSYTNAVQFRISYAQGYNVTTGFSTPYYVSSAPNVRINNIYYVRTGFIVPTMGWYTIHIESVASDGTVSAPCVRNVNVTQ